MDGCEELTTKQMKILLNHTDNQWNQRRSTMKPPENITPRKNRFRFCLDMVCKARKTKDRKNHAKVMRNHYNTCKDLKTFIAAAWTEEKVERLTAITKGKLPGCSFCNTKFHVRSLPEMGKGRAERGLESKILQGRGRERKLKMVRGDATLRGRPTLIEFTRIKWRENQRIVHVNLPVMSSLLLFFHESYPSCCQISSSAGVIIDFSPYSRCY